MLNSIPILPISPLNSRPRPVVGTPSVPALSQPAAASPGPVHVARLPSRALHSTPVPLVSNCLNKRVCGLRDAHDATPITQGTQHRPPNIRQGQRMQGCPVYIRIGIEPIKQGQEADTSLVDQIPLLETALAPGKRPLPDG